MAKGKKGKKVKEVKEDNGEEMTDKDLFFDIMEMIAQHSFTSEQLKEIHSIVLKMASESEKPGPDDTDGA